MTMQLISFLMLALVAVVATYKVVTARLITHAALWMALAFTAVAGVFLMLQQEFVAALQVLIYAGAITTMVIFAIMLSEIREIKAEGAGGVRTWMRRSAPLAVVVGFVFAVFMTYLYIATGLEASAPEVAAMPTVRQVGSVLFTRYTLPFVIAAFLLEVAMVGAIILTAKETE